MAQENGLFTKKECEFTNHVEKFERLYEKNFDLTKKYIRMNSELALHLSQEGVIARGLESLRDELRAGFAVGRGIVRFLTCAFSFIFLILTVLFLSLSGMEIKSKDLFIGSSEPASYRRENN